MSFVTCHCEHEKGTHNPQCNLCDCMLYRPVTELDPMLKERAQIQHVDKLLELASESRNSAIRSLFRRIEPKLVQLEELVVAEAEEIREREEREKAEAEARELVEALARQLAEAQEKLSELVPAKKSKAKANGRGFGGAKYGNYPCPEAGCKEVFNSVQGVTMHRVRKHGYRKEEVDA